MNSKREIRRRIMKIMEAANKGLLVIPKQIIPADMSPEQFAMEWTAQPGKIIFVESQELPQVFYYPDPTFERLKKSGSMTLYDLRKIKLIHNPRHDSTQP